MAKKFDVDLWSYHSLADTRKRGVQQIIDDYQKTVKYAKGRLKRLRAAGLGDTLVAERLKNAIIPPSELEGKDAKAAALLELAKATRSSMATPSGYKAGAEAFIAEMHRKKEYWINMGNYDAFKRFMEEAGRKAGGQRYYDSLSAMVVFEQLERLNVEDKSSVFDDFSYWMGRTKDLTHTPLPSKGEEWTAESLKTYLGW